MKALVLAGLLLFAGVGIGGCIVEEHHHHQGCPEGLFECSTNDTVDVCDDGYWEVYDDCWELCDGPAFCDYDAYGDPVCFCE